MAKTDHLSRALVNRHAGMTFAEAGERVIAQKFSRKERTRVSANLHIRKHLLPYFGHMPVALVNQNHWNAYVDAERKRSITRRLFNDWKHFKQIMKLAFEDGLTQRLIKPRNPDTDPTGKSTRKKYPKVFTDEEYEALLLATRKPETKLIIQMGCEMGMRSNEILNVEKADIDLAHRFIHIPGSHTKTGDERWIPIPVRLIAAISQQIDRTIGPFLFGGIAPRKTIKRAWRGSLRRANVKGTFHDLRRTACTRMLRAGKPAALIQQAFGFSDRVMKQSYLILSRSALQSLVE